MIPFDDMNSRDDEYEALAGATSPATLFQNVREFTRDVYELYRKHFWSFYSISLQAAIIAVFVYTLRGELLSWVAAQAPTPLNRIRNPRFLASTVAVNFASFYLAWLLEVFSFAAIASRVAKIEHGDEVRSSDGYEQARIKVGSISYIALVTFSRFIVLLGLLFIFVLGAIYVYASRYYLIPPWVSYGSGIVFYLMAAAAIMGYAFAIPIVMTAEVSGHAAMKLSWRATDGHEGKIFLLICESLVAGYLANYAAIRLATQIVERVELGEWIAWVYPLITAVVVAGAQVPMFIGFTLLYERSRATAVALSVPCPSRSPSRD